MDWVKGIQHAIDYVEDHITETIDYEQVAKQAYSSSFHFQRVFSILCDYTLGDYIRMRRLSLAGYDLASTDAKVIDIAYKYGYDSPESFSRAFTRFHGVTPSQAKQSGTALKSFSPLALRLAFQGGSTLEYRVETLDAFQIICRKKQVAYKAELTSYEISNYWSECIKDGTIDSLIKYIPKQNIFKDCIVGASFGMDATSREFPYAIGAHYNGIPVVDENLTVEKIPAHTYIVFPCKGKMPEAFQELYQRIYSEFFAISDYQPIGGTDFEAYPSGDVKNPDYQCEIWVAVKDNN